jgi:uncharacterized protein (TIGR02452 family)
MNTFTSQIPREVARAYGHAAAAIGERGAYQAPSGRTVDIRAEIAQAVQGTAAYPPDVPLPATAFGPHTTAIEVTNETTLSAAGRMLAQGLSTVALNFASATNPGGGFLNGARAQEEYLARSSCLYACIRDNPLYAFHRAQNDPFYTDYLLYSPAVPVIRGDDGVLLELPYFLSIITAAAVHANQVPQARRAEITPVMWRRILKVLAAGVAHGHDAIILGAWGCGAFGNDGNEIAHLFRTALDENFRGAYRKVVFAIVDWSYERRYIGPFEGAFGFRA